MSANEVGASEAFLPPIPDHIETRVTRLYGISYPIIQGGMVWTAGWKLAVAVSKAGGLGQIGAGSMKPDMLDLHIAKAREAWDGPLGVNIPLLREDAGELARVAMSRGIKIIFTSAGNPGKLTQFFHDHGATVTHVVPSLTLARKAVERGVDAIVGEGTEAGGHNGFEEIPTFPLIPRLADHIKVPLLAAGGVRDGRGLAAALALGADGVQVGTRFACTVESSASDAYKQAALNSGEPATILTLKKLIPTRMMLGRFAQSAHEHEARGASKAELEELLGHSRTRRGIFEGDLDEGYMEAGEVAGDMRDIPPAAEVVRRMLVEFVQVVGKIRSLLA